MASGQLEAMNLLSLIQMFEGERRTARLLLARGDEQGEITFVTGRLTQATQGKRMGRAAVYQLLTWQKGTFRMAPPEGSSQSGGEIDAPVQALLMEGIRRLDEIAGLREALANPPIALDLAASFRTSVQAETRPEAAAVLALLNGSRDLDSILAQSPLDDWGTLRIIDALRRTGALGPAHVAQRRSGPRLYVETPIEYQSLKSFQQTSTFNLSARGLFIRTATPYDMGEQLVLRFHLPGVEAPVTAIGQVVWRNADPAKTGGMGMGIQFVEVSPESQNAIERHLARTVAVQVGLAEERE